ncbi:MAG: endo alpha-1,4 polygalactosaminidase [Bdellovibrionales bacterium]
MDRSGRGLSYSAFALTALTIIGITTVALISANSSALSQNSLFPAGGSLPGVDPTSPSKASAVFAPALTEFAPLESFYWQLSGTVKTSVRASIYDIDMEDNERSGLIGRLKARGTKVICYFSAGTYENWRSDASNFPSSALGRPLEDWPGERWLDIRRADVRAVLTRRIQRAVAAGCDAIEPDNLDGYQNNNGLGLTARNQIDFLHWLAAEAHSHGISIGLKNTLEIIVQGNLHQHFDWALNEQCYQYGECNLLKPFARLGKAVFIAEYSRKSSANCANAKANGFTLGYYNLSLNGSKYQPCN